MVGGVHSWYNKIPHPLGGWPTNWRIIILQFSHMSESSEPHVRLPSLGVWHWEEENPEHLALKASGSWSQELHRTGGNRDSTLGGCTQSLMHTMTQDKSSDFIGAWARSTCWSWRVPGKVGSGCCSLLGYKRSWWTYLGVLIWRLTDILLGTLAPRPGSTQQPSCSLVFTQWSWKLMSIQKLAHKWL